MRQKTARRDIQNRDETEQAPEENLLKKLETYRDDRRDPIETMEEAPSQPKLDFDCLLAAGIACKSLK